MKIYFCFLFVLGFSFIGKGQEYNFLNYNEPARLNLNSNTSAGSVLIKSDKDKNLTDSLKRRSLIYKAVQNSKTGFFKNKVDYSLNAGFLVGTGFSKSFFTTQYLVPTATVQLSKKIKTNIGIGYAYQRYNGRLYLPEGELTDGIVSTQTLFGYSSLVYSLTDRTDIVGSIIFAYGQSKSSSELNSQTMNYKEATLGVNYKLTDHISINAQVGYGNYPTQCLFSPSGMNFLSYP